MTHAPATPQGRDAATVRVFFAIWPDAAALAALQALATRVAADARGRATAPRNAHLTLAFIGAVPESDVARLGAIGHTVAEGAAPFDLVLDRVGSFREAGVAWIGARTTPAPLQELAVALKARLGAAGFATDPRTFKAHLTLARRCERRPAVNDVGAVAWRVDAFTLTASELAPTGSRYRELVRFDLVSRS